MNIMKITPPMIYQYEENEALSDEMNMAVLQVVVRLHFVRSKF